VYKSIKFMRRVCIFGLIRWPFKALGSQDEWMVFLKCNPAKGDVFGPCAPCFGGGPSDCVEVVALWSFLNSPYGAHVSYCKGGLHTFP
jgi:hypothetical protein